MTKWYGNLTNRLMEGRTVPEITVGMDITMYHWSDRTCYYVTEVTDQKHIKVKRYIICADHDKEGGMGHQDWMYFKTAKEEVKYLTNHGFFRLYDKECEPEEETWVFRYGKWMQEFICTEENYCTERELKSLKKNGYYKRYGELNKVSFGVRDYYYDWEF